MKNKNFLGLMFAYSVVSGCHYGARVVGSYVFLDFGYGPEAMSYLSGAFCIGGTIGALMMAKL